MLSKKELKAADALKRMDISKMESRVLLCLFKKEGITAKQIERTADLRQPEVSHSVNALKKKGWIKATLTPKDGKGRPYDRFYLAKPKEAIISDLQDGMQKRMEMEKQDMQVLRELLTLQN